jgi:hypothetical protein
MNVPCAWPATVAADGRDNRATLVPHLLSRPALGYPGVRPAGGAGLLISDSVVLSVRTLIDRVSASCCVSLTCGDVPVWIGSCVLIASLPLTTRWDDHGKRRGRAVASGLGAWS